MSKQARKILIVDDEEYIVELIKNIITEMDTSSYDIKITTAKDGIEALDAMEETKFDLAFLDLNMPNVNGIEVISRVRSEEGQNKESPFVIVSANVSDLNLDQMGPFFEDVYFVDKPFDIEKIERLTKIWLAKASLKKAS